MTTDFSLKSPMQLTRGAHAEDLATRDAWGNTLDPEVGYARGQLLSSSADETLRLSHGQQLAMDRLNAHGPASIGNFTGNTRNFQLLPGDENTLCEEWMGPSLMADAFQHSALLHLSGRPGDVAALFNRTSAGNIAAIHALSGAQPVVSLVPEGGRSHASVRRGAVLAGVTLLESMPGRDWRAALRDVHPSLVILTPVTSNLDMLDDDTTGAMIHAAQSAGAIVLIDDAYGARLRPVLFGGTAALALGADLVITNCDKSGLHGPRAGLMAGRQALVNRVVTRGFEWGMEARAPLVAGALRALQAYSPAHLLEEAAHGQKLGEALRAVLGEWVLLTVLGPLMREDAVLTHLLELRGVRNSEAVVTPCEATAALGVVLLRDHGILTTNTHGQPGASAALRLKPTDEALARTGGIVGVASAVRASLKAVATIIDQPHAISELLFSSARKPLLY